MEDDHNDVQLLLTGVNDRNIGEYLGVIEKRIDDLIMVIIKLATGYETSA
jgi:hypothetical protein